MLQNTSKTLGFQKIMVYKTPPGGEVNHIWLVAYTHSRLAYDPTETILAILYGEVPNMLPAKYKPNPLSGSAEEVI